MKKLTAILIGAGGRGRNYTDVMLNMKEQYQVIAVAEPIQNRREYIMNKHEVAEDMAFNDWKPLLEKGKIADFAIISTMDRDHFAPAMAALEIGYDLLLEKPIAPTPEECMKICARAKALGRKVVICTVLRYTPMFKTIKDLIDSGKLGRIMSVTHEECVGNEHQSHSFVRGNWGNEGESSSMLLQKSCHDMDILQWLLGKKCKKVQSFGALSYFREENAPEGAPDYCIQGCPHGDKCYYNAVNLYLGENRCDWFLAAATKEFEPTDEQVKDAITNTQYGKCVYKCNNDVVDHQTVNLMFEDDITVTFGMNAFNKGGRYIHIMGTDAELNAALDGDAPIRVFDFATRETEEIPMTGKDGISGGHGGGDEGIIIDFYDYLNGTYEGKSVPEIDESTYNHMITFAAEEARRTGTVVDFDEYVKKFGI